MILMSPRAKESLFLLLLVLVSAVFWISVSVFVPHLSWMPSPFLWSTIAALFLLIILWSMGVILVESGFALAVAWAIASFMGVVFFLNPIFIGASALLYVFGLIGFFRAKGEIQNTLHGRIFRPMRQATPLMVTFLVVTFAVATYLTGPSKNVEVKDIIPEKYFELGLQKGNFVVQNISPGFRSDMTVREYLLSRAGDQITKLAPAQQDIVLDQLLQDMEKNYGLRISLDEHMGNLLYRMSTSTLERQTRLYKRFVPAAFAVSLFLTLRFLLIPVMWLAMMIALLLLKFLYRLGIVELRAVPATLTAYTFK